jgi:hypothetical protein
MKEINNKNALKENKQIFLKEINNKNVFKEN